MRRFSLIMGLLAGLFLLLWLTAQALLYATGHEEALTPEAYLPIIEKGMTPTFTPTPESTPTATAVPTAALDHHQRHLH
ncbi:MAG: hypothetical protein M5U34_31705 [Chloroflexi bacterium]|nr:hypothetical protein [Chloroflexota bacterium]